MDPGFNDIVIESGDVRIRSGFNSTQLCSIDGNPPAAPFHLQSFLGGEQGTVHDSMEVSCAARTECMKAVEEGPFQSVQDLLGATCIAHMFGLVIFAWHDIHQGLNIAYAMMSRSDNLPPWQYEVPYIPDWWYPDHIMTCLLGQWKSSLDDRPIPQYTLTWHLMMT
ncbi:hypothetical protein C7212DRAFT_346201 [Tuber magnatum]|uniref:Uncharacterized protein n=1 Tax=Tuber magnatum TaxID=42249 RepID=A0A317SIA8_9PEZI|nr:hypothetical protein C7212DRAFT_346201 [Tuber magnatum]